MVFNKRNLIVILPFFLFGCSLKKETKPGTVHPGNTAVNKTRESYDSTVSRHWSYSNLSSQFDIEENVLRYLNKNEEVHDSGIVTLVLLSKGSNVPLDTISVASTLLFSNYFEDSANVLSYATNVNTRKQIVDNYFGDLVVADLNFDKKDDIAIVSDMGGNGGPGYTYFLQNDKKQFLLNGYLTDSMSYFPQKINRTAQTLVTYVHAGACCVGEHVYALDQANKKWFQKSHRIIGERKSRQ